MKKGKKLLALIVGVVMIATMAITFAACGNSASTTRADVFWYRYGDAFLTTVREGDNGLTKLLGDFDRVVDHDSDNKQATQTDQVKEAIAAGTNLLIVNIVDSADNTAAQSIVDMAKDAGLPIIFFNREVADSIVNSYDKCMFIGTKPEEAGIMEGQLIAQFLLKDENQTAGNSNYANASGVIKYAILRGGLDNPEAQYRSLYSIRTAQALITAAGKTWTLTNAYVSGNGWTTPGAAWLNNAKDAEEKALSDADKAIMGGYIYGTDEWDGEIAAAEFKKAFASAADAQNKDKLGIIVGNNDGMALGVIEYLKNDLNLNKTATGAIPVFGVDATADALTAMKAGSMVGTILQSNVNYAKLIARFAYISVGNFKSSLKVAVAYTQDSGIAKVRMPYEIVDKA